MKSARFSRSSSARAATSILAALLLAPATPQAPAAKAAKAAGGPNALPQPIQQLAAKIQGREPQEIRSIIERQLGGPSRDEGSGLSIPQWDSGGGVLTFHPQRGVTFARRGQTFWLLKTRNPALANILGDYEMYSLPDKYNPGYWLGNLKIRPDGSYLYTRSSASQSADVPVRIRRIRHFFRLHARGKARILLAGPMKSTTLLEGVPARRKIADILFTSSQGPQKTFLIVSEGSARTIDFGGARPLNFEMYKSWNSFWR